MVKSTQPPELITFSEHGGDWAVYVEVIYQHYLDGLVNGKLTHKKLPIRCQFRPSYNNKGFAFWHCISEGDNEETRTPDMARCERILWIPWVIRHAEDSIKNKITWWENKRGSNTHVVIFLEEENYVVILAKRKDYYLFKTAYCANPQRKRQLIREREEYWKSRKTKGAC
jgi:hypothetical protein